MQGDGRGLGKSGKGKGGESACNKSPNWFNSVDAHGHKIPIGQSDKFPDNQSV